MIDPEMLKEDIGIARVVGVYDDGSCDVMLSRAGGVGPCVRIHVGAKLTFGEFYLVSNVTVLRHRLRRREDPGAIRFRPAVT